MTYTAIQVVDQLNKLLQIDRALTEKLVDTRYPVSKEYTQADEFVYMQENDQDIPHAGMIGVLNGLVLDTERYRLAANYNDDGLLIGFSLLELGVDHKCVSVYPPENKVYLTPEKTE